MCLISIISAKSCNNIIGNDNALPWYLPSDLKHFKTLTQGSVVIMGRKTYESIGKPLPNRLNVVISSQNNLKVPEGVIISSGPNEAIKASRLLCLERGIKDIWIIGGAGIYQQFLKRADRMILTTINKECIGDTVFPHFKSELWELKQSTKHIDPQGYLLENPTELGLEYTIEEYERMF
jgi:dihydrofolate reductase